MKPVAAFAANGSQAWSDAARPAWPPVRPAALRPGWTMVIAFYNEAEYLPATLSSLTAQQLRPFRIVLVDNGSTDTSCDIVRAWAAAQSGIAVDLLHEPRAGQVHALAMGLATVTTELVAIGDADTVYPPDYLLRAGAVFASGGPAMVALFAHDASPAPMTLKSRLARSLRDFLLIRFGRGQTYAGGYAHLFRTAPLRAAGGYSPSLWPYVLKDHELVHRVSKHGRFGSDVDLLCHPSPRRADRRAVRWTLAERIIYHFSPYRTKDWFFYRYLAPRLAARGLADTVLRARPWAPSAAAPAE